MASLFLGPRDGALPEIPSEQACPVCGQHALDEDTPHEFAGGLSDRLICGVCGAHRVSG